MLQRGGVIDPEPIPQIRGVELTKLKQQLQNAHPRFRAENILKLQDQSPSRKKGV